MWRNFPSGLFVSITFKFKYHIPTELHILYKGCASNKVRFLVLQLRYDFIEGGPIYIEWIVSIILGCALICQEMHTATIFPEL